MSRTWRRVAWFVIGCLATALFVAVLYALLQGAKSSQASQETTVAIRQAQKNNHQLLHTINDCTKPTGKCYLRGQRRTADAVASINRVVILAAACAVGKTGTELQVQAQIQACVIRGLARQDAHRH